MINRPVVIITGVSGGIGTATARKFAAQDWLVVGTIRDNVPQVLADIGVDFKRVEMEEPDSIARLVEEVISTYGRIDAVVANAGYAQAGPLEEQSYEDMDRQFKVNVLSVAELVRQVLPQLRRQGGGTIVGLSSIAGMMGIPGYTLYSASKFALEGLFESLRYEAMEYGIKVRLVEPSVVNSRFWQKQHRPSRRHRYNRIRQAVDRTLDRSAYGLKPEAVADVVWRAVRSRTQRLHWPVGVTSPVIFLKHFVPDMLFYRWVRKLLE